MTEIWELLLAHFPEAAGTHKHLAELVASLRQGGGASSVLKLDQVSVPAIQHLKTVFHYSEQNMVGYLPCREDYSLSGEFSSLASGLEGLREIISNSAQFSFNARKRLEGRKYDASLMDFFIQDTTKNYLQSIGVQVDQPLERRRRFGVLLDALVDRV